MLDEPASPDSAEIPAVLRQVQLDCMDAVLEAWVEEALADVLANEGGVTDIEVLCAALLHDTIEDTKTRADELRTVFGATVAGIAVDSTAVGFLPEQVRDQPNLPAVARGGGVLLQVGAERSEAQQWLRHKKGTSTKWGWR